MRILVIRRDNIGDLICTTPLLSALRRRFPQGHIAALVNSYNAPVLRGNPDVDAVHVYTKLKHRRRGESVFGILTARLRMLADLRREPFDYVILASAGFNRHGLKFARQLRRRHVVGFANGDEPGARSITLRVPALPYTDLHEVQVLSLLAKAIGVAGAEGPLSLYAEEERVQAWRRRLPELCSGERPWIAVHISARKREQQWPLDKWRELVAQLTASGAGVVIVWAPGPADDPRHPGDDEKASALLASMLDRRLVRGAPTGTLEDLIAVLGLCRGFIGADGGAMHVAAALGLPVAALFEGLVSTRYRWYPWRVPHEVLVSPQREISAITPAQVMTAWQNVLNRVA